MTRARLTNNSAKDANIKDKDIETTVRDLLKRIEELEMKVARYMTEQPKKREDKKIPQYI